MFSILLFFSDDSFIAEWKWVPQQKAGRSSKFFLDNVGKLCFKIFDSMPRVRLIFEDILLLRSLHTQNIYNIIFLFISWNQFQWRCYPKYENSCSNCCFNNHLLFTCSVRLELEGCDGKVAPVSKQKTKFTVLWYHWNLYGMLKTSSMKTPEHPLVSLSNKSRYQSGLSEPWYIREFDISHVQVERTIYIGEDIRKRLKRSKRLLNNVFFFKIWNIFPYPNPTNFWK